MKKLFIFICFLFFSCSNVVTSDENSVDGNLKLQSKQKIKGIVEEKTEGVVYKSKDGIVYLFNEKSKEGTFNNAFTLLTSEKDKLNVVENILKGEISYEYNLHYVSFFNHETKKKILFVVSNDNGHNFIHKLSTQEKAKYEDIIFVYEIAKINDKDLDVNSANPNLVKKYSKENIFLVDMLAYDFLIDVSSSSSGGCSSGGEGSTSCEIHDVLSGCSVSCGSGYYACCSSGSNTCTCVKIKLTKA